MPAGQGKLRGEAGLLDFHPPPRPQNPQAPEAGEGLPLEASNTARVSSGFVLKFKFCCGEQNRAI